MLMILQIDVSMYVPQYLIIMESKTYQATEYVFQYAMWDFLLIHWQELVYHNAISAQDIMGNF